MSPARSMQSEKLPPREMFPFQSRFFPVGQHKLHYVDEGSGPVVLLLHSCPFWIYEFRALIRDLRRDHRVIAIDQIGFGLSIVKIHYRPLGIAFPESIGREATAGDPLVDNRHTGQLFDNGNILSLGYACHGGAICIPKLASPLILHKFSPSFVR